MFSLKIWFFEKDKKRSDKGDNTVIVVFVRVNNFQILLFLEASLILVHKIQQRTVDHGTLPFSCKALTPPPVAIGSSIKKRKKKKEGNFLVKSDRRVINHHVSFLKPLLYSSLESSVLFLFVFGSF